MLSRRRFRQKCLEALPPGGSIEGSAMDELRFAFIKQRVRQDEVGAKLRSFLDGPPGLINRLDVLQAFPRTPNAEQSDALAHTIPVSTRDVRQQQDVNRSGIAPPAFGEQLGGQPIFQLSAPQVVAQLSRAHVVIPVDDYHSDENMDSVSETSAEDTMRRYDYVRVADWEYGGDGLL
jgi:hypothetical protein